MITGVKYIHIHMEFHSKRVRTCPMVSTRLSVPWSINKHRIVYHLLRKFSFFFNFFFFQKSPWCLQFKAPYPIKTFPKLIYYGWYVVASCFVAGLTNFKYFLFPILRGDLNLTQLLSSSLQVYNSLYYCFPFTYLPSPA